MSILLQRVNLKNQFAPFLFSLLLAGCTTLFGNSFTNILKNDANAYSEYYINKIEQTTNNEDKQTYKLLAARVLVAENKIPQAEAMLAELRELNEEQLLDKTIIEAHILAIKGNNQAAQDKLNHLNLTLLSLSQQARYYEILARIAENKHHIIDAVKARIKIDYLLIDIQKKQQNNDRTWALLRTANPTLIKNPPTESSPALAGWLALTSAYNENINQPTQLSQALKNWKIAYPNHTANNLFPTELQGLFNFQQTQLTQIGLLLPLSGDAKIIGNTIKRGFDDARGDSPVRVIVFNTLAAPIENIIDQIKQQGITAIVGPLLKQNVDQFINRSDLLQGLTVLTLNSTANVRSIGQLCYYGLAPEDEAESAANRLWNQGIHSPFIIVPQNDLGRRTASAFNTRWQQLSGTDSNIKFYNHIDDIGFMLQSELHSNNQALYLVAQNNEQMSEIKTIIDNSNTNLKLFASSRSHSSNNGPEYRLLMNGLEFSDIPFFTEIDSTQYKKVEEFTKGDYSLMRLYAMGYDAWLLINQLNELRQIPGFTINGLTGKLSAGPNCNIERDMTWYQYQNATILVLGN